MEGLVKVNHRRIVCDSLRVARHFKKEHKNVLRAIEEILAAQNSAAKWYYETTYENRGKQYPMYLMTRDGFALLVMGFTGKRALDWKIKYIEAFNRMERVMLERKSEEWKSDRQVGKEQRRVLTDTIQRLTAYALEQNPKATTKWFYVRYTTLANDFAGINERELSTIRELNNVCFIEGVIDRCVSDEMAKGTDYHDIYKECKKRVNQIKEWAA